MTSRDVDGSEAIGPSSPQGNSGTPPNLPSPPRGVRELVEIIERELATVPLGFAGHLLRQAVNALTAQDHHLAELTKERDEAREALAEALIVVRGLRPALEAKGLAETVVAIDEMIADFSQIGSDEFPYSTQLDAAEALIAELEARSTRAEGLLSRLRKAVKARREVMALSSPPCTAEMIRTAHKRVDDAVDALLSSISGGEGKGFGQTPEQPQCGVAPAALTDQPRSVSGDGEAEG